MEDKIYLKNEFESFLSEKQKLPGKTIVAYISTFKNNLNLIEEFGYSNIEKIVKNNDTKSLLEICLPNFSKKWIISKGTFDNFLTHSRLYIQFILFFIEQKISLENFEDIEQNFNIENEIDTEEDYIIEEGNLNINEIENFSKEFIYNNFTFRLITQNRFNKCGLFFPISFLKQYFYKTDDKKYFDNKIKKQINNIKLMYGNNQFIILSKIDGIKKSDNNELFFYKNDYQTVRFNSYCSKNEKFEKFVVNNFSEIAIDHSISMNTILNDFNKTENFEELTRISERMKKFLKKPLSYKKLIARGTSLSNDIIFINEINKDKLKSEFEFILNEMDLQLMHKKHNNYKRAKV